MSGGIHLKHIAKDQSGHTIVPSRRIQTAPTDQASSCEPLFRGVLVQQSAPTRPQVSLRSGQPEPRDPRLEIGPVEPGHNRLTP